MTELLRRVCGFLLRGVDFVYHWRHHSEIVGPMLLISPSVHSGPDQTFEDGTLVREGDNIGAIHFNNQTTIKLRSHSSRAAASHFMKLLIESLEALARRSVDDPVFQKYSAYCGITWLPPHGGKLGFVTVPIEDSPRKKNLRRFFSLLVWIVAPAEESRKAAKPEPIAYWMTRKQLLSQYLEDRRQEERASL